MVTLALYAFTKWHLSCKMTRLDLRPSEQESDAVVCQLFGVILLFSGWTKNQNINTINAFYVTTNFRICFPHLGITPLIATNNTDTRIVQDSDRI